MRHGKQSWPSSFYKRYFSFKLYCHNISLWTKGLFHSIAVMRLSRPLFTQCDPHHLEFFYLTDTKPSAETDCYSLVHADHDLDMTLSSRHGLLLPQSFGLEINIYKLTASWILICFQNYIFRWNIPELPSCSECWFILGVKYFNQGLSGKGFSETKRFHGFRL